MPSDTDGLPELIILMILLGVILFVGLSVASATLDTTDNTRENVTEPALLDATTWTTIDDNTGTDETVKNSLGNAVTLTGANDSYYQSTSNLDLIQDDTWTISTGVKIDPGASGVNQSVLSSNGELIIWYNASNSTYDAWFYENGGQNTYRVSVNVSGPTNALTTVTVARDGDTLTIYRNTTAGASINVTQTNTAPSPANLSNLNGTIDEVRAFDDALNSSQRTDLHSNRVAPLPNTNRTARIMFDEQNTNPQLLFFSSGSISLSNATITPDGYPGSVMDPDTISNQLAGTVDYDWSTDGPEIRATDGGELDGAPVAYAQYTSYGLVGTIVGDFQTAMILAGILIILLPLGAIIMYLRETSNSR